MRISSTSPTRSRSLTLPSGSILLDTIDKTKWPGDTDGSEQRDGSEDLALTPLDLLPSAVSAAKAGQAGSETNPEPLRPHRGKPRLRRGKAAQFVTLGEMPLRVGQPYLFVHQGDDEHIWSLEEVRYAVTRLGSRSKLGRIADRGFASQRATSL